MSVLHWLGAYSVMKGTRTAASPDQAWGCLLGVRGLRGAAALLIRAAGARS